ncbi:FMN-dependent NADH-azoreductase [Cognatiluteimonas profundi]|uniref:FMN-dependent NADH-azoreductase n=1 Tax=Cognatiluteimonas profundi TaxID=2594501 RepID=UPI00131B4CAA|nr:NAD(P)H-dependent oxidoreductase [Lysobacter profundi]
MKLLHVDSSILGQQSASRELSAAIVTRWKDAVPGLQVTYRDLDAAPLPHVSGRSLAGADAPQAAEAGRALQEFLDADVVVIGAPMYNFGIPSTLKAWIDRLAVAGKTFHYTPNGPEGLAGGKKIILASTRGGFHQHSGADFQEPYLRYLFGFFGITDIEIVRAEGLAVSPEQRTEGMTAAHRSIVVPLAKAA